MALPITTTIRQGDDAESGESRLFAQVTIGQQTVTVYESLIQNNLVIVDVDTINKKLRVTVDDQYVYDNATVQCKNCMRPLHQTNDGTFYECENSVYDLAEVMRGRPHT
jgi:hypothetical protein